MQLTDSTDRPNVFVVTRTWELHGRPEILNLRLLDAGWVNNDGRMVCPRCPAATDTAYRKTKELAKRARRAQYPAFYPQVFWRVA